MESVLRVAGIVNDSITDGPGLRFTLFLQGCNRQCKGCHNPATHPLDGGTEYTLEQIAAKICANPLLEGVTFSGGEPFLQASALVKLAEFVKGKNLDLAVYTGYTLEELQALGNADVDRLLLLTDVLIDGEFVQANKSLALKWRGSGNQRIIDVPSTLKSGKVKIKTGNGWE